MCSTQWRGLFWNASRKCGKTKQLNPKDWTEANIANMKSQLKRLGLSIDWDKEISTCSPDYYKHQQEFFFRALRQSLVYRKESYVNWDPVDQDCT